MKITLQIRRYDPERDKKSHVESYEVTALPTDRVLDALLYVKDHIDGSLGIRKSCAHGVCGSDAMVINGKEGLACKTLVRDVADTDGDTISVAPLAHLTVQRDLMVDQGEFFAKYRTVKPYFIPDPASAPSASAGEHLQSPEDRKLLDDPTSCILCGACYSACPVLDSTKSFLGPAAVVNAARFVFDSRDSGLSERLEALDASDGVWACENHFECTRVCPRTIKVTKNINLTKRRIEKERERPQ